MIVEDIVIADFPGSYVVESMTHSRESRYLMRVRDRREQTNSICIVDIKTRGIFNIGKFGYAVNIVTRGDTIVLFIVKKAIVLENRTLTCQIDIKCKHKHASGWSITDRYCQQLKDDIYAIDDIGKLWRISWLTVITKKYHATVLIDDNVEDFYMHEHGNAILKTTGIMVLNGGPSINLQDIDSRAKWSAVIWSTHK